jgi:phosphoribosylformylglycinamidine synthase
LVISAIDQVRIGKHITLQVEASDEKQAHTIADEACRKVLCNQVMESYSITINAQ